MSEPPNRIDLLRSYFDRLANDMRAAGKFVGHGENRVAAMADALLAGGGSMLDQFWTDVRAIGGEKGAMAAPIIDAAVAGLAADGAHFALKWAGGKVKDLLGAAAASAPPPPEVRRRAGAALMATARKMGGNRK